MSHQQPNMTIMYHVSISRSHNSLFVIHIAHCTSHPLNSINMVNQGTLWVDQELNKEVIAFVGGKY